MMRTIGWGAVATLLVACGEDGATMPDAPVVVADASVDAPPDAPPPSGFTVSGMVAPVGMGTVPAKATTMAIWSVETANGDGTYKYGAGTSAATKFQLGIATPLPEAATFGGALGVAVIALFDETFTLPDGLVEEAVLVANVRGFTGDYAVVFKGMAISDPAWVTAFPMGLSCGKCVRNASGSDSFMPVACNEVVVQAGPLEQIMGCDWF